METSVEKLSSVMKKIKVTFSCEDVRKEIDAAFEKIKGDVQIPGFRRGKAPKSVVEMRMGETLRGDATQNLVSRGVRDALKEHNISPVSEPELEKIDIEKDSPLTFEIKVEVMPEFELPNYRGLKIPAAKVEPVTNEAIEQELELLREEHATYVSVEGRAVIEGDVVTIDYTEQIEGKDALHNEKRIMHLGKDQILPDIKQNLVGMKLGEVKEFESTLPEDFYDKSVAGKSIKFRLELKEIKVEQLPELNDGLAKETGKVETLEELKQQIRSEIEKGRRSEAINKEKSSIFEELVQRTEFEIPPSFLEKQTKQNLARHMQRSLLSGKSEEDLKKDREQIFKNASEQSVNQVKGALILEKIAEKENIKVTDEEIDRKLEEIAQARGLDKDKLKEIYQRQKHYLEELRDQMFYNKMMDFLHEHAVKKSEVVKEPKKKKGILRIGRKTKERC